MSLQSGLIFYFTTHILDYKIVCIDIDGLVPDNELLVWYPIFIYIPNDLHDNIINIKFVGPHCQKIKFLRVIFFETDQEETDSSPSHVTQEIDITIIFIDNCLLDMINFVQFIEIDLFSTVNVSPNTILARSHNKNVLIPILSKYFWLTFQSWIKLMDSFEFNSFDVHLKNLIFFCENYP